MFAHIFKGPSERPLHATTTSAIRSKPIAPVSQKLVIGVGFSGQLVKEHQYYDYRVYRFTEAGN